MFFFVIPGLIDAAWIIICTFEEGIDVVVFPALACDGEREDALAVPVQRKIRIVVDRVREVPLVFVLALCFRAPPLRVG